MVAGLGTDGSRHLKRSLLTAVTVAAAMVLGFTAIRAQSGSTRHVVDGINYDIPLAHVFNGAGFSGLSGLDKEPADSVWLTFPAADLATAIPGYSRTVKGYRGQVDAGLIVNVAGGKEAREFPQDLDRVLKTIQKLKRARAAEAPDAATGAIRLIETDMGRGSSWYLVPPANQKFAVDRLPPACQSTKDSNDRDLYDCQFTVVRDGRSFTFSLNEENMPFVDQTVDFVAKRLAEWRRD